MSTRGYLGIRKKSELKGAYNHFDSYLSGLGVDVLKVINEIPKDKRIDVLNETYDFIELVNEEDTPSQEQVNYCVENGLYNKNVSSGDKNDWYCLLRNTQGNLQVYVDKKCKYMLNGNDFINDSLFCEYTYIIDLDTNELLVYTDGINNEIMAINLEDINEKTIEEFKKCEE